MRNVLIIIISICYFATMAQNNDIEPEWAFMPISEYSEGLSVIKSTHDINQNIYICAKFSGNINVNRNGPAHFIRSNGDDDYFFAKYDSTGNLLYVKSIGGVNTKTIVRSFFVDSIGNLYITGEFDGAGILDIDPSSNQLNVTSKSSYFLKLNALGENQIVKSINLTNLNASFDGQNLIFAGTYKGTANVNFLGGVNNITSQGGEDIFFGKYTQSGSLLWVKSFGGSGNDTCYSVAVDNSNSIVLAGTFSGQVDLDPSTGIDLKNANSGQDIFLSKFDSSGSFLFSKQIESVQNYDRIFDLGVSANNSIYLTCTFNYNSATYYSAIVSPGHSVSSNNEFKNLVVFDSNGNYHFDVSIRFADKLCLIDSNRIYITRHILSNWGLSFIPPFTGPGYSEGRYLCLYDYNFNLISQRNLYLGSISLLKGNSISVNHVGKILLSSEGTISNPTLSAESTLFYTLSNGTTVWQMNYGKDVESTSTSTATAIDNEKNMYFAGAFKGTLYFNSGDSVISLVSTSSGSLIHQNLYVAKFDSTGDCKWVKKFYSTGSSGSDPEELVNKMIIDKNNDLIILGWYRGSSFNPYPEDSTYSLPNLQYRNYFYTKLKGNGDFLFSKRIGGSIGLATWGIATGNIRDVAVDNGNNCIVVGEFDGTSDFDPSAATYNLTSTNTKGGFVSKYDSLGNFVFAYKLGNPSGSAVVNTIALDSLDNIYIGGAFNYNIDLDPSAASLIITDPNNSDVAPFIAKYTSSMTIIEGHGFGNNVIGSIHKIKFGQNGCLFVAGNIYGNDDFDFSGPVYTISNNQTGKSFIAKYNSNFSIANHFSYNYWDYYALIRFDVNQNNEVYFANSDSTTIRKLNQDLTRQFTKITPAVMNSYTSSYLNDIVMDGSGHVIVCGSFNSNSNNGYPLYFDLPSTTNSLPLYGAAGYYVKYKEDQCVSASQPIFTASDSSFCIGNRIDIMVESELNDGGGWRITKDSLNGTYLGLNEIEDLNLTSSTILYAKIINSCFLPLMYDSLIITVNPKPIIDAYSSESTICLGESVIVWGMGGSTYYVQPNYPDSSIITPTTTGSKKYVVVGTDVNGCINKDSLYVQVKSTPTVDLINLGASSVCIGSQFNLSLTGSSGLTKIFEQDTLGTASTYTFPFSIDSTAYVTGEVIGTNQCVGRDSVLLTVNQKPTIQINNDTLICVGESIVINGVTNGATASWNNGIQNGQSITPIINSVYIFSSTSNMGCLNKDTLSINVTECVWPGDPNYNGIANNTDLLEIGLGFGSTGTLRASFSNAWQGHFSLDWAADTVSTGYNLKHADCNGDGTINLDDTLAINLNYGLTHTLRLADINKTNTTGDIYFGSAQLGYAVGQQVAIDVYLGESTNPLQNFYGAAFTIDYNDNTLVQPGSLSFSIDDASWVGTINTDAIRLTKPMEASEIIDAAICKTNHINTSGAGKIGTLRFIASNTIGNFSVTANNAYYIDNAAIQTPLTSATYTVNINTAVGIQNQTSNSNISIYPNPNNGTFTLSNLNTREEYKLEVKDMLGRIVYTDIIKSNSSKANIKLNQAAGVYWLQISSKQGGTEVHKVVVE